LSSLLHAGQVLTFIDLLPSFVPSDVDIKVNILVHSDDAGGSIKIHNKKNLNTEEIHEKIIKF